MKRPATLSIRAYATQLAVDEKAVRKAIKEGKISKGYDATTKKIKVAAANKEWGQVHQEPKPQRGVSAKKASEKREKLKGKKVSKKESVDEEIPLDQLEDFSYTDLIKNTKVNPNMTYSQALRVKEILAIAEQRMKVEEQQKLLVRKEDVDKAFFAIGDELKKALLNVPARCIDELRAAANPVEATNILKREINLVLGDFAKHLPKA